MFRHVARGLRDAARQPKLLLLLWSWSALLGVMAARPARLWWREATAYSPQADVLAERLHLATLIELGHHDGTLWQMVTAGVVMALLAAFVTSPLVAGGVLEVLSTADQREPRRFFHRFFRGAGHFYWRFLVLLLLTVVMVALAIGVAMAVLAPLLSPLRNSPWEPAYVVRFLVLGGAAAFLALTGLIVLDFARIRLVRGDSTRVIPAWFRALWIVVRHPLRSYGIWTLIGVLLAALVLAYASLRNLVPSSSGGLIVAMVVMQQAFVLARAGLRVATVGAELDAYRRWFPPAAADTVTGVPPAPVATAAQTDPRAGPAGPEYSI